jgi:hypothetical protein
MRITLGLLVFMPLWAMPAQSPNPAGPGSGMPVAESSSARVLSGFQASPVANFPGGHAWGQAAEARIARFAFHAPDSTHGLPRWSKLLLGGVVGAGTGVYLGRRAARSGDGSDPRAMGRVFGVICAGVGVFVAYILSQPPGTP